MYFETISALLVASALSYQSSPTASRPAASAAERLTIEVRPAANDAPVPPPHFTARFTPEELMTLLESPQLPEMLRHPRQREAAHDALQRVAMEAVLEQIDPFLRERFAKRFHPARDLIETPVERANQTAVDAPDLFPEPARLPSRRLKGFLLHDVSEDEYLSVGVRVIQVARQLLDSGDPVVDRTTPEYYRKLADVELEQIRAARQNGETAKQQEEEIRRRVGEALGLTGAAAGAEHRGWLKESRRFSYIIKEGEFIQRLKPLVERINREMRIAGYSPPTPLDRPGIYYDPEIGDVDIVLPAPMLAEFLAVADELERRMAEDAIVSIEAVRITDREIVEGAIASRVSAQIQGVHDVKRFPERQTILRELGLNALLAVANQRLQAQTLEGVASGALPAGTPPLTVAPPTLPPVQIGREVTTLGTTFSVGADDVFFRDGAAQISGFSYIGPDGIAHTLTTEVVDSLRELWERIERNLIVHKIKKTESLTEFSVPVGPNTRTYRGIAALISQENQQLVVATGTGAISEISATAGTWLVIENFQIMPIPGSATTLTRDEKADFERRVLLTMFLRDPFFPLEHKRQLLETTDPENLAVLLERFYDECAMRSIRPGEYARTYARVHDDRLRTVIADQEFEKKERNSSITLTFFSSQGNIVQSPGTTQLGDANDLTSFTTELRPNIVTPISSFFTKSGSGLTGTSPLTGIDRGERTNSDRSMTHLIIRARFPTTERERADRDEGRHLGYFELPFSRRPSFDVDVPFLSSSEHPLERLARLRIGLMFEVLDASRIARPMSRLNPNRFPGDVPSDSWATATARMIACRKIIADSRADEPELDADFVGKFVAEVRSLLEYDDDFFNSPNVALRNMTHWNDPDRIALALNNSPGRFALERLVKLLDELGERLVPQEYAERFLATSPPAGWHPRRIYPLSSEELTALRRDVAVHFLRYREAYGDAFLEAVLNVLRLGTYRTRSMEELCRGVLRGYRDLVIFDNSGSRDSDRALYRRAHDNFLFLKRGGYRGRLFEKSMLQLSDLPDDERALIYRGTEVLRTVPSIEEYR
ncbi:MAG: hypothetical protein HUU22_05200 [Phycisphaerae bacterium]|nr:hypothetical protein [Phycisphaerae bacterium]NUQ45410.1 hypothetical protein [Phycisphaerae bacterium]